MFKPKVGDKVFLKYIGRYSVEDKYGIVDSIGKKYFYIKDNPDDKISKKFLISTGEEADSNPRWCAYRDEEHYHEQLESDKLFRTVIMENFNYYHKRKNFSLDQIKRIIDIINE